MFEEGYSLGELYPIQRSWLGKGFTAIANTIDAMRNIIKASFYNIRIRNKATSILVGATEKDQWMEVDAIYNWVRDNTRYTRDPQGMETLQSPLIALDMIEQGHQFQGDCDDLTILTLSLLKAVGYPVKIRISAYIDAPNQFRHVYGLVRIYNQWIPIEPINKDCELGWESPGIAQVKDYDI